MQTDPIGYEGGVNLYTYCKNNPVNWLDPYGLFDKPLPNLPAFTESFPDSSMIAPTLDIVAGGIEAGFAIGWGAAAATSFVVGFVQPEAWLITSAAATGSVAAGWDAYSRIKAAIERLQQENTSCQ